MNSEAPKRRRHRRTESLEDVLSDLRIRNRKAWFDHIKKIRSPHVKHLLAKKSEKKLKKASKSSDKEKRNMEEVERSLKKMMQQELQKKLISIKNSWMSLGQVFSLLFDQGPIELISSMVFTLTKSLMTGIKSVFRLKPK
ncbi:uncharacterized protein LOC116801808 [Drosophila sechellia]|uniref:uncharacterized protein LOC116801808 n=1 Tax=Drosophila sechellia TaxID=7238 RepID=UPI0013DE2C52|nr:uncharacterized protein LOC116801808 [Drosophila sechellia]